MLDQAFEEDGSGNKEEAFELYAQAAELFLKLVCASWIYHSVIVSLSSGCFPGAQHGENYYLQRNGTPDKAQQTKIEKLAAQALDRYETQ